MPTASAASDGTPRGRHRDSDEARASESPRRYWVLVDAGIGASATAGSWFESYTQGRSWQAGVRLAANSHTTLGLRHRRQWLGIADRFTTRSDAPQERVEEWFLVLGLTSAPRSERTPQWSVQIGIGSISGILVGLREPSFPFMPTLISEVDRLALRTGAGVVVPLGRRLGIEIEGNLRVVGQGVSDPQDPSSTATGMLFGLDLRALWMIGT